MKYGRLNVIGNPNHELANLQQLDDSKFEVMSTNAFLLMVNNLYGVKKAIVAENELSLVRYAMYMDECKVGEAVKDDILILRTEFEVEEESGFEGFDKIFFRCMSAMKIIELLRLYNSGDIIMRVYQKSVFI